MRAWRATRRGKLVSFLSRALATRLRGRAPRAYARRVARDTLSPVPRREICARDIHAAEVQQLVRDFRPDLGLSIGAPFLAQQFYMIPAHGTINAHLGLAPRYRGVPPGFWELFEGSPTVGATIHFIDEGIDSGPVIASAEVPILPSDTLEDVESQALHLAVRLLAGCLPAALSGVAQAQPQETTGALYRMPGLGAFLSMLWRTSRRRRKGNNPRRDPAA